VYNEILIRGRTDSNLLTIPGRVVPEEVPILLLKALRILLEEVLLIEVLAHPVAVVADHLVVARQGEGTKQALSFFLKRYVE